MRLDPVGQHPFAPDHIVGHVSFGLSSTHENDYVVNLVGCKPEGMLNGFNVFIVLPEWILETRFPSIDDLCPFSASFASEYPSTHVFRFDHKNAEAGYDEMINLSGAVISRGQDDVIDDEIVFRVELSLKGAFDLSLPNFAFEPSRP